MGKFFINIYHYFNSRKAVLYALLIIVVSIMAIFALRVNFDEDVTSFFPDAKDNQTVSSVFKNLKVKDKILVLFSVRDTTNGTSDPDLLIEASEKYLELLRKSHAAHLIKSITTEVNASSVNNATDYIYNNLPILLNEDDYAKLDSITTPSAVALKMESNYNTLISPMGIALKDIILKDPLGLASGCFSSLQELGGASSYNLYNGYIFSEDLTSMLVIIDPINGAGSTGQNDALVSSIENEGQQLMKQYPEISVESFGGPLVGVYNARQIKRDTMVTLTIALLIIIIFISMAFRNRWAMLLITAPVLFGALFALSMIYFIAGSISAIAIGAGAAVFGIAMSYSIHVLTHRNHTQTIEQVIDELAYPLTIGSFTTIGAFLGLLFTSSKLLRDFGLFAALSLVGTTIFCLIFLPHLLPVRNREKQSKLLTWVEKVNSYRFDKNRWIIGSIGVLLAITFLFYNDVRFDSDMLHLNFESKHLKDTEQKINRIFNTNDNKVVFVSVNKSADSALISYADVYGKLNQLKEQGEVQNVISVNRFLIPLEVQKTRLEIWNNFWTPEKKKQVIAEIERSASRYQFAPGSFDRFKEILDTTYTPKTFSSEDLSSSPLFKEWVSSADSLSMLLTQVEIKKECKDSVYSSLASDNNLVILDKGYFSQKMAIAVRDDFNLILYISSILIFIALLISYGRLELALISFVPMALSWIIILGLMAILGIEFNIVNIILSTFIFGIGDDFSIFIMDGLQNEYSTGKKMLSSHKTAIFFSAFTTIVGMGALVFAKHPALQSISVISILGMVAVVMISYTVQPILFRLFITKPAQKGGQPYTVKGLFYTIYTYSLFVTGCAILQGFMIPLLLLPISQKRKKRWFHAAVSDATLVIVKVMVMLKKVKINDYHEDFSKPAVIVANHQSFIDIIILLSLSRKVVMVTNGWVWNSPIFGRIVRFADFYHAANGYESLVDGFKDKVANGYSIVIFPEGTRSEDGNIKRFHKGAFYLAEQLNIDILPIVLYGNGMAISKRQPFLVKTGTIVTKILKRIEPTDPAYGVGYNERSKVIRRLLVNEYNLLSDQFSNVDNPASYDRVIKSYIYKGPVLEWYMRVKIRMEKRYRLFDELIPRDASVTDIGCGYGPLAFMLATLSPKRNVLGIDYDEEKIAVANNSAIKGPNLSFVHANILEYDLPYSDVFVLNDVLHYMSYADQQVVLNKCFALLNPGGMVIVRDGDDQKGERHKVTQMTEKLSTQIFRFNKSEGGLFFSSTERMKKSATDNHLQMQIMDNDSYTSNTIYIFTQ